ncbi:hypothetical protein Elgi_37070 [Paenibacillus elgii]|uniref:DUF2971 domain-containing protein n=1 Tax=Paenibacillus elgii TaxID=189691 RepID=UPI002D7B99E4|nr:hypothetical protein Elgi_37070 [Paenibacillus elgii]
MGMTFNQWAARIANRTDLTGRLTHLTKPLAGVELTDKSFEEINRLAVDSLLKILSDQKIIGSDRTGYIVGTDRAVCFQDTPIYGLIQNVEHEKHRRITNPKEKIRYCGVGLSFIKPSIYHNHGGRPVFYEKTEIAKEKLSASEWWRIVDLEYIGTENNDWNWDIVDWTHEREWRVKGDMSFTLENGNVHIVLYDPLCVTEFLTKCSPHILKNIHGITTLTSVLM